MRPNIENIFKDKKYDHSTPYVDTVIKEQKKRLSSDWLLLKASLSNIFSTLKKLTKFKFRKLFPVFFRRSERKKFKNYRMRNKYILNYQHNSKLNDDILEYAKKKLNNSDIDFDISFELDKKSKRPIPVVRLKEDAK